MPALNIQLIHSAFNVVNKSIWMWLCASLNFMKRGKRKTLDTFYDGSKLPIELHLDRCIHIGWAEYVNLMPLMDFLNLNQDKHDANINVNFLNNGLKAISGK